MAELENGLLLLENGAGETKECVFEEKRATECARSKVFRLVKEINWRWRATRTGAADPKEKEKEEEGLVVVLLIVLAALLLLG